MTNKIFDEVQPKKERGKEQKENNNSQKIS